MADLTIKGLPDELHARLKAQAERNRRSLNAEAMECLERGWAPWRSTRGSGCGWCGSVGPAT